MATVVRLPAPEPPPRPERAGIYARISDDELGLEKGITRQADDGTTLAQARGWTVQGVYSDNDISATKGGPRPGYQQLMDAVRAGRIDRIVVYQSSRLWRNRSERAAGIEVLAAAGVTLSPVKGPELNFTTAYGRGMAGMLGEFDTMESEVKSERIARAALQRAQEGRANGVVAYGWRREYIQDGQGRVVGFRDVEHPQQAEVVRDITRRLLRGESLLAVTADLNARGVPAPGAGWEFRKKTRSRANPDGTLWAHTSVKKLVLRPGNAGLRIYHRGRPDERMLEAEWPPIVDRGQWEQLRALLGRPGAVNTKPGGRKHLLTSGVGLCGVCGGELRVAWRGSSRYGSKQQLYVCDQGQCVGRRMSFVDDLVSAVVLARLRQPDALDWMFRDDADAKQAVAQAAELRARLAVAADQYADGKITAEQMERITARLRPDIAEADTRARSVGVRVDPSLFAELARPEGRARWGGLAVSQRRALLEALGVTVVIHRSSRRGPGFDRSSVQILPWQAPGTEPNGP